MQIHVGVREARLTEEQFSEVEPLQGVRRCEAPKRIRTAFRRVGCIIESAECVGAPLLCSRLTESRPVSEAAQADSMQRLAVARFPKR